MAFFVKADVDGKGGGGGGGNNLRAIGAGIGPIPPMVVHRCDGTGGSYDGGGPCGTGFDGGGGGGDGNCGRMSIPSLVAN